MDSKYTDIVMIYNRDKNIRIYGNERRVGQLTVSIHVSNILDESKPEGRQEQSEFEFDTVKVESWRVYRNHYAHIFEVQTLNELSRSFRWVRPGTTLLNDGHMQAVSMELDRAGRDESTHRIVIQPKPTGNHIKTFRDAFKTAVW